MATNDSELDRLLRAAAKREDEPAEAPFGFDTRVVAAWRSSRINGNGGASDFARFFRRVAAGALIIAVIAGAGAVRQFQQDDEFDAATGGAYAMADSVFEAGW